MAMLTWAAMMFWTELRSHPMMRAVKVQYAGTWSRMFKQHCVV